VVYYKKENLMNDYDKSMHDNAGLANAGTVASPKSVTALDKIRNKVAENNLAAQHPEVSKSIVARPQSRERQSLTPLAKKPRLPAPKYITFPTFFRTFADMEFRSYDHFAGKIDGSHWNLKKVVLPDSRIQIEVPDYLEAGGEPLPARLTLETYSGESFTSGELFYKIHKALVERAMNSFMGLRGAKLTLHPHHSPCEDEPSLYGFYTDSKWFKSGPYAV
jgi:hypothetical protein